MSRDLSDRLARYTQERFVFDLPFTVHRKALTPDIISQFKLPTRPTKQKDPRAAKFEGESVELDALEPNDLRALIRDDIAPFLDAKRMAETLLEEKEEREALIRLADEMDEE